MDPIDYSSAFNNLASPNAALVQGLQVGTALRDQQVQQRAQAAALTQQQQKQQVITSLVNNPNANADDYAKATLLVPELHAQFKQSWDTKNTAQQQSDLRNMTEWSTAIQNGKPQIASDGMRRQAEAIENSNNGPTQESKALRMKADNVDSDPQSANFILKSAIYAHPDGKKVIDNIVALGGEDRAQSLAPAKLREANAEAGSKEADTAQKSLAAVGSALGALQGKGAKPAQVQTALKSLASRGIISKDDLPDYLASIPTDAKQRDEWLGSMRMAGMKPDDQMKYTTPDANTKANNDTSRANTASNNATQLAVQSRIDARQDSKGNAEASLDDDTVKSMAAQYLAGDKSVMQNLGRGAQGAANIVALRKEITNQAKDQGLSGPQIAAKMADYAGLTAGIRTSAQISARVENAISEAKELAPLAIAASKEVSRSGLLPFGKIGIMFDTQTNNPALKKFVTANNGLVTAYGGAMARGQKPTVSDYEHAREILATAQSQQAYEATVNQMFAEMAAASRAPQNVREHLRGEISGANKGKDAPSAAPALPSGWSVKEH